MLQVSKQVNVKEITLEEVINHPRKEYNPNSWKAEATRYTNYQGCKFYLTEKDEILVIYIADNIRFLKELSYSSCLSSGGFQQGFILPNKLVFQKFENNQSITNNKSNRLILAENTKRFEGLFYYN